MNEPELSNISDYSDMTLRKQSAGVGESNVSKGSCFAGEMQGWIERLASFQNRLYYRDQIPQSLNALVELVHQYNPTKIVELGTLSGLSLRAWLSAKSDAEIIAIDRSFAALHQSQQYLPADLSRVNLLEQDILRTDFAQLWSDEDKVILYVDAHDTPSNSIMAHILKNALPVLPNGSVVAVDDLWYCSEAVSDDTVSEFFNKVATNEIDSLGYFDGYYAPYWKGGFFIGFPEVIPLMEWVNHNSVNLSFRPGNKMIMFERQQAGISTSGSDFNLETFNKLTGSLHYNPVDRITVYEEKNVLAKQQAVALCQRGKSFFAAGCVNEALDCFSRAIALTPNISGAFYAKAICLARQGQFDSAVKALQSELNSGFAHPNARILHEDIKRYMAGKLKYIVKQDEQKKPEGLTIFAMPKSFTDAFALIQENAIRSWMSLKPRPEIILFGDDDGIAEFAQKHNLKHVQDVQRNEFGTPLVNDLFLKAQAMAANEICVYVNTDIILMDDFTEAIEKVSRKFEQFLMIGRRWDIDITEPLDFGNEKWQEDLKVRVKTAGSLHLDRGIDYFAYRKGLWGQIPQFALGRSAWDNWLVYAGLSEGKDVVDATEVVTIVHQSHNFSHVPGGKKTPRFEIEIQWNRELAGPVVLMGVGAASDATWRLTKDGLVRNKPEGYITHLNALCCKLVEKGWDEKYSLYKKYFDSVQYLNQVREPTISIVVISWSFHPDTVKSFKALAQQRDENFELIFVNNGAENDSFEDLMPFIDTYIRLNQNTGAYLARNIGALFARAPLLLFLDDDGIADKDILQAYIRNFEKYDVIAVRGAVWPKEEGAEPYGPHRYYGSRPFPCFSCQEGNTAYDVSAFYRVGGWDDEIRLGHGGIDLSRRLLDIEPDMRKQMYSPEPVIYHDSAKDKKILEEKSKEKRNSAERLKRKHPDFGIFQQYYQQYFQREDLLIRKDAQRAGCADTERANEYAYPYRGLAGNDISLQRAQAEEPAIFVERGKELPVAVHANNRILAEESFRKGFEYLRNGNAAEALKHLDKAAVNSTGLPNLYFAIATAYAQLGDLASARKACQVELSLQPENDGAKKLLGKIERMLSVVEPASSKQSMSGNLDDNFSVDTAIQTIESPVLQRSSKNNIKISIILTVYKKEFQIAQIIKSIINNTTSPFQLVIVYDGYTDKPEQVVNRTLSQNKGLMQELKVVRTPDICELMANNAGMRIADGEYWILLQDDMLITEKGWEKRIIHPMEVWSDVFSVSARNAHSFICSAAPEKTVSYTCTESAQRDVFKIRDAINRGPLALRASTMRELNYFDEAYFPGYFDDMDLCTRAYKELGKVSGVYHIDWQNLMATGGSNTNHVLTATGEVYKDVIRRNRFLFWHRYHDYYNGRNHDEDRVLVFEPARSSVVPAVKSIEAIDLYRIGSDYGGWAVDLDLVPDRSVVISAGVGEDVSFDMGLIDLKKCRIIGIDPTEKARKYIEDNKHSNISFVQKALCAKSGSRIKMYKNTTPEFVSDSILPSHSSVSEAGSYTAGTINVPDILSQCPDVSVLKMDIEGAEYEVISSLDKLDVPQVCIEFHHFCSDFTEDDTKKCIEHMKRLGYVAAYDTNPQKPFTEFTFIHKRCVSNRKPVEANIGT